MCEVKNGHDYGADAGEESAKMLHNGEPLKRRKEDIVRKRDGASTALVVVGSLVMGAVIAFAVQKIGTSIVDSPVTDAEIRAELRRIDENDTYTQKKIEEIRLHCEQEHGELLGGINTQLAEMKTDIDWIRERGIADRYPAARAVKEWEVHRKEHAEQTRLLMEILQRIAVIESSQFRSGPALADQD